jgi:pimeloyl-ACP methyl ester carboxylesterase
VNRLPIRSVARSATVLGRKSLNVTVHLRRMYVDCRFGQLHVHTAFPSSGGFDELTPLVCVPPGPLTGRVFARFASDLGNDRSVYAPDLPGCGDSDAPETVPSIADYAAAVGDLLDSLRLRSVDLLGYQSGSLVAAELAIARPEQVRRVLLVGVPVADAKEREAYNGRPWPARGRADGTHLPDEWQRLRQARGANAPAVMLGQELASSLAAGDRASWCPTAAHNYAPGERLPLLRQPTLVLRPRDEYWDMTVRADALLRDSRRVDLENRGGGLFDDGAPDVARYAREFLER